MSGGAIERIDRFARGIIPLGLSLILVIVSALPFYMPGYGPIAPNIAIMAVFYWTIYRPDLFPVAAAFAVGLWQDALVGTPLGLYALLMVLAHTVVATQRRFFQGKSFPVVWWAFAMVAAGAALALWLATMALNLVYVDPSPAVFQFLLTAAAFPFLTWVFARTHHATLRTG
jgi:rod shape-determining protein MreD